MTTGALSRSTGATRSDSLGAIVEWAVQKRLHVVLAALIVAAVAIWQNGSAINTSPFHPDESRWLNRAGYTSAILHPFSSAWEDRYLTRGQPPGGSYVTGIGLLLQGRDLDTNGAWDFYHGGESLVWWNASRGNMPAWDDVEAARRTSAFLGTVTALALFIIGLRITNVAGGLVAGLFLAMHPLSIYLSSLGVSDAAFTTMTALATLAAMALAAKPTWWRAALLGLALGIGAATKLSPLFLAFGLAGIGLALAAEPVWRRIPLLRWIVDRVPGFGTPASTRLGWMLLCQPVMTIGIFLISYPFLWSNPLGRTRILFDFRRAEMDNQARIWPDAAVDSRIEAFRRTWTMLEDRYSTTGDLFIDLGRSTTGHGIDLVIGLCGLAVLVALSYRRGISSPTFLALATAGGQALLIIGGLRVDFERYYLPIVFLNAICAGVLAGVVWETAIRAITSLIGRRTNQDQGATAYAPRPVPTQHSAD